MRGTRSATSRRDFLKRSAAAALPWVVPASVFGGGGAVAPSGRIGLGLIGVGMMGRGHLHCCLRNPGVQVLAVCDVDRWRRESAKAAAEGAYAARKAGGYAGCRTYNDLRELLDRQDIDAVLIATGDRWHALATSLAAKAGKDIYCEKPVSLTIREARAMVEVVRRYGRVFQSGLQQRSTPEFQRACTLVRNGAIGSIRIVYVTHPGTVGYVSLPAEPVPDGLDWDQWLGPAPWRPFNKAYHHYGQPRFVVPWHICRAFGGGNLTSNTVHAFDVVQWGLGMDGSGPVEITPPGAGQPLLTYRYASGVLAQVTGGRLPRQRPVAVEGWNDATPVQAFGAVFVGDRGWIHVGRQGYLQSQPPAIAREARSRLAGGSPVVGHHQNWLDCIRTRRRPSCDVAIGARSTIVSHLGCIAHWTGRRLRWDPAREEFLGDDDANRMRARTMREPWQL